jgi:hypothetical protein
MSSTSLSTKPLTPSNISLTHHLLQKSYNCMPNTTKWYTAEQKLSKHLRDLLCPPAPDKLTRLQYYSSGIYNIILDIIKAEDGKHRESTVINAWLLTQRLIVAPDSNEKDNIETASLGVELGFPELAVWELKHKPLRCNGSYMYYAFLSLTVPSSYAEFTNHILSIGAHSACLDLIHEGGDIEDDIIRSNIDNALRVLNFIAGYATGSIRGFPHLTESVEKYLPLLSPDAVEDEMILLGFNAAKIIIRAGPEGGVDQVIEKNPYLMEFYPKLIRSLLDIGIGQSYYLHHRYWKIPSIALDLSLISLSISPKKKLIPFIPLMVELITFHHNGNRDVIHYGMIFLYQIILDKEHCFPCLVLEKERLRLIQQLVWAESQHHKETLSLMNEIMSKVFD